MSGSHQNMLTLSELYFTDRNGNYRFGRNGEKDGRTWEKYRIAKLLGIRRVRRYD